MISTLRKIGLAALVSASFLFETSCEPTNFNVKEMKIDSDLHLLPVGDRRLRDPGEGSYYSFFYTATGLTTVDHFETNPRTGVSEQLIYLEAGRNQVLDRTVKTEQILKGAYGTVYSTKTCFYASPLSRGHSTVSVGGGASDNGGEIPIELPNAPESLPSLTSISVVRIFSISPEYIIVGGNYEPDGRMGGLQLRRAKGGDHVGGGNHVVPGLPHVARMIKEYGLPDRLDIQKYLRSSRLSLPSVAFEQEIAVVDLHYGYDKLIRQDVLKDGVVTSSHFLRSSVTQEENILDPLCESRFHQQQMTGVSTVF
jgi:hypothetical protein